jgi:hypothetical protein
MLAAKRTPQPPQPQRQEPDERCAPAQVSLVLAIERADEARRLLRRLVPLAPAGNAAALAFPGHHRASAVNRYR